MINIIGKLCSLYSDEFWFQAGSGSKIIWKGIGSIYSKLFRVFLIFVQTVTEMRRLFFYGIRKLTLHKISFMTITIKILIWKGEDRNLDDVFGSNDTSKYEKEIKTYNKLEKKFINPKNICMLLFIILNLSCAKGI